MAIQTRRGRISDLDKAKLLPGEWACALDQKRVFMQFGTDEGSVLEMPTKEEYETMLGEVEASAKDAQNAAKLANVATSEVNNLLLKEKETLENITQAQKAVEESATATLEYKESAKISAQAAADSRDNAQTSAELTAQNLMEVQRLTQETEESTANAKNHASLSKSYAVGTNGKIRENDAYDNAKSYCEQAKSVAESLGSPITPQGTVAFEDLPLLSEVGLNWMYNISNEFTTTDDFDEGAGNVMPAGTNVYKIASGKWDCFAGSPVTGIKGNKEKTYRKGNVNLTPENIGALAEDGDSRDNTVTFTSADSANPAAWTDVQVLTTGEKHSSLFGRISTMFKNVRYLYRMLGTTDISSIGDGTATGAIKAVNTDLANVSNNLTEINDITNKIYPVGSIYMSVNNVNPSALFGGTWQTWGAGRVPVGINTSDGHFNTVEKTGGALSINLYHSHTVNSHNHTTGNCTLTVEQIPPHSHYYGTSQNGSLASNGAEHGTAFNNSGYITGSTGGGQAHNHGNTGYSSPGTNAQLSTKQSILQPYIVCYMWKRTA